MRGDCEGIGNNKNSLSMSCLVVVEVVVVEVEETVGPLGQQLCI